MKKSTIIIIILFFVVSIFALYLVLNKGHIGSKSLVYVEKVPDRILEVKKSKEFISSVDNEILDIDVTLDGEKLESGYRLVSSNESIVKINENNEIEAVKNGKATITVRYDISQVDFDIRVITPIKSINFTTTNSVIRVGKELQLKLKATPSDASIDSLLYVSSDEKIATVNANGIVTGVSEGKVTITLIDQYSGEERDVKLTIKK